MSTVEGNKNNSIKISLTHPSKATLTEGEFDSGASILRNFQKFSERERPEFVDLLFTTREFMEKPV